MTSSISYNLVFDKAPEKATRPSPRALLTSPLLSKVMHRDESVAVIFSGLPGPSRTSQLSIDSFQIDSMVEYLNRQAHIQSVLEPAIEQHMTEDDLKNFGKGHSIWKHVKVYALMVRVRQITTREQLASLQRSSPQFTDEHLDQVFSMSDKPETCSRFMVLLQAKWSDGHERMADFRDCELMQFRIEG